MTNETVEKTLAFYGLSAKRIHKMMGGYRSSVYPVELTDDRKVILLFFKTEPNILDKISTANRLSNFLANLGYPTRQTLDKRVVKLTGTRGPVYACLYNQLPGKTIAWEAYTMDHIKVLGMALAKIHLAALNLEPGIAPNISETCNALLNNMRDYFSKDSINQAMAIKLKIKIDVMKFKIFKSLILDDSNSQLLHMDFVRGNILFDEPKKDDEFQIGNARISGIIDFEKASFGNPIHDIARSLAFLLVDCKYKTADKVKKYFIESGYKKYGGGQIADYDLLDGLVGLYLTYDFYKFLLHNPYEFLNQNEHFLRTRDILRQREILI